MELQNTLNELENYFSESNDNKDLKLRYVFNLRTGAVPAFPKKYCFKKHSKI